MRRKARMFVGDSIVMKTDTSLDKGEDVIDGFPGTKLDAIPEIVEEILVQGRIYSETTTGLLNATDTMDETLSIGRPGVVLLLLLAVFCSHFPGTTGIGDNPTYIMYYFTCIEPCRIELLSCHAHCRKSNTCEASRDFCRDLCSKAWHRCEKKRRDKSERLRITNSE
ncbi:hypothetical protein LSAT2_021401 [Lamellibrachia satsuma]|nr:hypothetical protein LSAT2_021401 [Lamellibrachia satsuma]